ncbi:MAG: hypothetical protein RL701_5701 [Pseudomonadota bacterium]|jgi:AraC-like DNA-binding protein
MVRALVGAVEPLVSDRSHWLAAAGFDPTLLDDSAARVTAAAYERVKRSALEASGDEALGLHMTGPRSGASFDVVAHLANHAATLREGLAAVIRYASIYSETAKFSLHERGETALLRMARRRSDATSTRLSAELAMTGILSLIRQCVGSNARPERVSFQHEAPEYRAEYTRIFAGTECFAQGFTGIELKRSWLDCTQPYKNADLYEALRAQAERELRRLTRDCSCAGRVEEYLLASEPAHLPNMDEVAHHLAISARSLRRRLQAEDVSYKKLLEHALTIHAVRMLESPGGSIQETAYRMGFHAPAAFHRAFKRWTGTTPKAYMASY